MMLLDTVIQVSISTVVIIALLSTMLGLVVGVGLHGR